MGGKGSWETQGRAWGPNQVLGGQERGQSKASMEGRIVEGRREEEEGQRASWP